MSQEVTDHLNPHLQKHRALNLTSHEQESQISCICAARLQNWTKLSLTVTPHSSHSGKGQKLWCFLPRCRAKITETLWKKLTYNFLNICYHSRFLPPVSWQGLVRLTWSGFKPIVRLLLQPVWTCQLWLRRREAGCCLLPDASDGLLLEATLHCSRSGHRQKESNGQFGTKEQTNVALELLLECCGNFFAEEHTTLLAWHASRHTVYPSHVMIHSSGQCVTNRPDVSTLSL